MCFTSPKKTGLLDFPEKRASTKVKHLLPANQVFTEGNARKFTGSFAFCAHVDAISYQKRLTFPFERAQITSAFVPNARAIVKL